MEKKSKTERQSKSEAAKQPEQSAKQARDDRPRELGGRKGGLDPTRYGDWEKNGRCIDF